MGNLDNKCVNYSKKLFGMGRISNVMNHHLLNTSLFCCLLCAARSIMVVTNREPHALLCTSVTWMGSGPWFNIKMPSYHYGKSHCGDKTILRPSYLHNGISYTGKMTSLYWIRDQMPVACHPKPPGLPGILAPWFVEVDRTSLSDDQWGPAPIIGWYNDVHSSHDCVFHSKPSHSHWSEALHMSQHWNPCALAHWSCSVTQALA